MHGNGRSWKPHVPGPVYPVPMSLVHSSSPFSPGRHQRGEPARADNPLRAVPPVLPTGNRIPERSHQTPQHDITNDGPLLPVHQHRGLRGWLQCCWSRRRCRRRCWQQHGRWCVSSLLFVWCVHDCHLSVPNVAFCEGRCDRSENITGVSMHRPSPCCLLSSGPILDTASAVRELHRQMAKEKALHDLMAEIKVLPLLLLV